MGLDIGGTKTELVALDAEGRECLRRRDATPHGCYKDALRELAAMVRDAEHELGERATVGIGLPGAVSPASGLVKNAYATPYNGKPLKADLERLLGRELRFENDANCFALSEAADGAARGARLVLGAILGTGAGGGDASCARTLDRYVRRLARAFAHVINLLDPEIIVVGGGLSRIERIVDAVPRIW